jgi:hypothetical protein
MCQYPSRIKEEFIESNPTTISIETKATPSDWINAHIPWFVPMLTSLFTFYWLSPFIFYCPTLYCVKLECMIFILQVQYAHHRPLETKCSLLHRQIITWKRDLCPTWHSTSIWWWWVGAVFGFLAWMSTLVVGMVFAKANIFYNKQLIRIVSIITPFSFSFMISKWSRWKNTENTVAF